MFSGDTISLVANLRSHTMATAVDALVVKNAAAASVTTAMAQIDIMETQLDNIAQQLQVLIAAAGTSAGGGGSGCAGVGGESATAY